MGRFPGGLCLITALPVPVPALRQFFTNREAIRRVPKATYQALLEVVKDQQATLDMEFLWPALLTGQCHMWLPDSQQEYYDANFHCKRGPLKADVIARR